QENLVKYWLVFTLLVTVALGADAQKPELFNAQTTATRPVAVATDDGKIYTFVPGRANSLKVLYDYGQPWYVNTLMALPDGASTLLALGSAGLVVINYGQNPPRATQYSSVEGSGMFYDRTTTTLWIRSRPIFLDTPK